MRYDTFYSVPDKKWYVNDTVADRVTGSFERESDAKKHAETLNKKENGTFHDDIWCPQYDAEVLPDERGNCSLCGARLSNIPLFGDGDPTSYSSTILDALGAYRQQVITGSLSEREKHSTLYAVSEAMRHVTEWSGTINSLGENK